MTDLKALLERATSHEFFNAREKAKRDFLAEIESLQAAVDKSNQKKKTA